MNVHDAYMNIGADLEISSAGSTVIYNDGQTEPVELIAVVDDEVGTDPEAFAQGGRETMSRSRMRSVSIPRDETRSGRGVDQVKLNAKLTIDGEEWTIVSIRGRDAAMTTVNCRMKVRGQTRVGGSRRPS